MDLDNTLVKGQSQKLFISYLFERKIFPKILYFKLLAWFVFYRLGFIKNPEKVMREAFKLFGGHSCAEVENVINDFFEKVLKNCFFPEAQKLVEEHRQKKRFLVIATNVLEPIARRVGQFLEISHILSTKLEIKNNVYTGEVDGSIMYGQEKFKALESFLAVENLTQARRWVYSDHISDFPILEKADYPFVVNPDPKLFREAREKNWPILLFKK